MPKDHNGSELKVGDVVAVPCVITGMDKHDEYINVALETRWPMSPGDKRTPLALNTHQVMLIRSSFDKKKSYPVIDVLTETIKHEIEDSKIEKGRSQS